MTQVDKNEDHRREYCQCTIVWSQALEHIQNYFLAFSNEKTVKTLNFIIDYFAKPYHARHETSSSLTLIQSLYMLRNNLQPVYHYNENDESFKQLPLIDKLATIADQYRNRNFANRMQHEDPQMHKFMITEGFAILLGMNEDYDHNRPWINEKLGEELFCSKYKDILTRFEKPSKQSQASRYSTSSY